MAKDLQVFGGYVVAAGDRWRSLAVGAGNRRRLLAVQAVLAAVLAFAVGCGAGADHDAAEAATADRQTAGGDAAAAAVDVPATGAAATTDTAVPATGIRVADALGRTVELPAPPQRIVLTGRSNVMLIDAVYLFPEVAERIVAIGPSNQGQGDFLPLVDPAVDTKIRYGRTVTSEELAAARPDLVILKDAVRESLGRPLEELGIPVVYLGLETPQQFEHDIRVLGAVFAAEQRAQQIIDWYAVRLDDIRLRIAGAGGGVRGGGAGARSTTGEAGEAGGAATGGGGRSGAGATGGGVGSETGGAVAAVGGAGPVGTLVLEHSVQGGVTSFAVAPGEWMQTLQVRLAGGRPIWTAAATEPRWTQVSFEQIAAWDPPVIAVLSFAGSAVAAVEQIHTDPLWSGLQAVQHRRVAAMPGDFTSWGQPGSRWILGTQWLARQLYPEAFADAPLAAVVREFFGELYGLSDAEFEASVLPIIQPAL